MFDFTQVQSYPFRNKIFHDLEAHMGPPLELLKEKSENKTQMAFTISHQGQLLQQVSSKSVDPDFQHLEHFLRQ